MKVSDTAVSYLIVTTLMLTGAPPAAAAPGDRSPDGIWIEVDRSALGSTPAKLPRAFRAYRLDFDAMQKVLTAAPPEDLGRGSGVPANPTKLTLPMPDGTFAWVSVEQSPVLGARLAAQYPAIKTFAVHGIDDRAIEGRLTLDPSTVQALFRPPSDYARVTPLQTSEGLFYINFLDRDRTDGANDFSRGHDEHRGDEPEGPPEPPAIAASHHAIAAFMPASFDTLAFQSGGTLRQFSLVAVATGEYYQARDMGNGNADVVSSIAAEVNNANVVFGQELAVRLSFDWVILFPDPTTDPYPDGLKACELRDANTAVVNNILTLADYDIGFAFGTGGGNGCAWYVVCLPDKARGAGLVDPSIAVGGSTGLLVHEMGHQLGARHTFSGSAGSCGKPGEFNKDSAFEPGSGSTIASYSGSCDSDNVDLSLEGGGMYYHTRSFDEIINTITNLVSCGGSIATGNTPPTVNAGSDYTIPQGTPFTLTGSGADADNDALEFNWEQFNVAETQRPINTDLGDGPIFRSVNPKPDPARTFPNLTDLLSNTVRKGEILPSMNQSLAFRLTARDNRTDAGGVVHDTAVLTVQGDPFFVTSPNGGEIFGAGCPLPVAWTIGGGSVAANVSLGISDDGGNTFSTMVASTANDGAASGETPCPATTDARVKAAAVGNVFFDVSNNDFTIVQMPPAVNTAAAGGAVDDACEFTVTFKATVQDDCGQSPSGVSVAAIPGGNNFTLGPVQFNTQQTNATTVEVTGSVLVSDLTSSPALLSIKVTGADACGAAASNTVLVQIVDNTPPQIAVTVDPAILWPPNHQLTGVQATVTATDNCPGVGFVLTSVTSSEPDDGLGDGDTVGDIQDAALGTPDVDLSLRAERAGGGPGRIYTLLYTATDGSQNQAQASALVVVPHDKKDK